MFAKAPSRHDSRWRGWAFPVGEQADDALVVVVPVQPQVIPGMQKKSTQFGVPLLRQVFFVELVPPLSTQTPDSCAWIQDGVAQAVSEKYQSSCPPNTGKVKGAERQKLAVKMVLNGLQACMVQGGEGQAVILHAVALFRKSAVTLIALLAKHPGEL
jgi:hypothetical protein